MAREKKRGVHWDVIECDRACAILIVAPHSGQAEPHTGRIAEAIAGTRHSLYRFETLVSKLHITSHRFTEPTALDLTSRHSKVLTVHGCNNKRSRTFDVFVGGLDRGLRDRVIGTLITAGFRATTDIWTRGEAPGNICNKGTSGTGVQLEIARRLRDKLGSAGGRPKLRAFAKAINSAIQGGGSV